jgi:hypothetical protein
MDEMRIECGCRNKVNGNRQENDVSGARWPLTGSTFSTCASVERVAFTIRFPKGIDT